MPNLKQTSQSQNKTNSTTSEIDLEQLTLQELMDLKDRVNAKLATVYLCRMSQNDVVIEYELKARTKTNVVHESSGTIHLPAILHPSLIPNATGKLEQAVNSNILEPLAADLLSVFDAVQPNASDGNSVLSINQQVGQIPPPI